MLDARKDWLKNLRIIAIPLGNLERRFAVQLRIRKGQPSGGFDFVSERIDYAIHELTVIRQIEARSSK